MATDTERSVETMHLAMRHFQEDMMRAEKSSEGVAKNITDLVWQIKYGQQNFREYLGQGIGLNKAWLAPLRHIAGVLFESKENIEKTIKVWENLKKEAIAAGGAETKVADSHLRIEKNKLLLRTSIHNITGKQLAAEFVLLKSLQMGVKQYGELNTALINANSSEDIRYDQVKKIYQVQTKTGASIDQMAAASKALTSIWPKARPDFQSTLEVMIQMEQGLGVSYENSVQLARVFEINLKTPVRDIADQIAIIANSTSLAADEAAKFATEIGNALVTLGPGGASQVEKVTDYVTMLAGRMRDAGGDAGDIIRLFQEMTKGTAEGFQLRGIAGVFSPGAIGSPAGAQAAFEGIDRMIKRLVNASPGSPYYVGQLEVAHQMLTLTTDSIVRWNEMMKKSREPLDQHALLENRWNDQMTESNSQLKRLEHSFMSLIHQAIMPAVEWMTNFFKYLADWVSKGASSTAAITTAFTTFGLGVGLAILALGRLATALSVVTWGTYQTAKAEAALATERGLTGEAKGWLGYLLGGSVTGGLLKGTALRSIIYLAAGAAVGLAANYTSSLIESKLGKTFAWALMGPTMLLKLIAEKMAGIYQKMTVEPVTYTGPRRFNFTQMTPAEAMSQVRKLVLVGREQEAESLFLKNAALINLTQENMQDYINRFAAVETEMREWRGITAPIMKPEDSRRFNLEQLKQTQEVINRLDSAIKLLKDTRDQEKATEEKKAMVAELNQMRQDLSFRLPEFNTLGVNVLTAPVKQTIAGGSAGGAW